MMAVKGGIFFSLCFLDILPRNVLRLMSLDGRPSFVASWSSMRAFATSAQHRRKRSLSGARFAPFFFGPAAAVVTVVVAMVVSVVQSVHWACNTIMARVKKWPLGEWLNKLWWGKYFPTGAQSQNGGQVLLLRGAWSIGCSSVPQPCVLSWLFFLRFFCTANQFDLVFL